MESLKPQFPIDFTENGDTTSQAIEKHIKELGAMYDKITEIYGEIQKTNEEARDIWSKINAYGTVVSKNIGTAKGEVPTYGDAKSIDAIITGTAANITGILAQANGGTGTTSLQAARNLMGLGNTLGTLPVSNGGTGATNAGNALSNLGGMLKPLSSDFQGLSGTSPNIPGTWLAIILQTTYTRYDQGEGNYNVVFKSAHMYMRLVPPNTNLGFVSDSRDDTYNYSGFFWRVG